MMGDFVLNLNFLLISDLKPPLLINTKKETSYQLLAEFVKNLN